GLATARPRSRGAPNAQPHRSGGFLPKAARSPAGNEQTVLARIMQPRMETERQADRSDRIHVYPQMAKNSSKESKDRSKGRLILLFAGGILAGAQVGKAIVSLPLMNIEIHVAGLILAVFATLGAIAGIAGGAGVSWLGARNSLIAGLLAIAAGNMLAV